MNGKEVKEENGGIDISENFQACFHCQPTERGEMTADYKNIL